MKIGLISDTHGYLDPRVERIFAGVDHILHAGDIGVPLIVLELGFIAPVTAVLGNNDDGLPFKETEVVTLDGDKFLVHHIVQPTALHDSISTRIQRERPAFVVFGHTHKQHSGVVNGIHYLNPGYSGRPRFGSERSVALLEKQPQGWRTEFIPL
jgi:putative phosphoesterase